MQTDVKKKSQFTQKQLQNPGPACAVHSLISPDLSLKAPNRHALANIFLKSDLPSNFGKSYTILNKPKCSEM